MTTKFASSLAFAALVFSSSAAVWIYDPSARTLSGNGWTLTKVTANEDKELTIPEQDSSLANAENNSVLDFSDGVADDYSIVSLGYRAFRYVGGITEFIAPSTLREICQSAFYERSSLTSVVMECPHLTTLGDDNFGVFQNCTNLKRVRIVAPLKEICSHTFNGASLAETDVADLSLENVEVVGYRAFYTCKMTGKLVLRKIRFVGDSAFSSCSGLTGLHLDSPDLETVEQMGFNRLSSVTDLELSIPNVRTLGNYAFNLMEASSPSKACLQLNKVETIGLNAFVNCKGLADVRIESDYCETIDNFVFEGCANVTNLVLKIPNAKSIGTSCFINLSKCASDVSEWRLDSLEAMPLRLFRGCSLLHGVMKLPSVTNMDDFVFYETKNLNKIILGSPEKLVLTKSSFDFNGNTAITDVVLGTKEELPNPSYMKSLGKVKNVTFWGPAQTATTLNSFFGDATNYKTRLIVSKKQAGWTNLVTPLTDADKEHADYPSDLEEKGMKILGTTAGKLTKTVWVVHSPSPYDSKGGLILVVK